jgi:hypothetical protein
LALALPRCSPRTSIACTDPALVSTRSDAQFCSHRCRTRAYRERFLVDNVRTDVAGWTCEASCFANNPQPDLQDGLGELEIKAETLRYIVCASNDLLADYAGRGGLGRARRLGTRATQHTSRGRGASQRSIDRQAPTAAAAPR